MEESIQLYFSEGSSDKVYVVNLKEVTNGWMVNFAYGRRGAHLTTGTKTAKAVPYAEAKKIYTKLVNEKGGKGYKPRNFSGSKAPVVAVVESRDTGVRPQLLNEIEEEDIEKYLTDDDFCAQEKYDGRNRTIVKNNADVTGVNRKGLSVALPEDIEIEAGMLPMNCILNGEIMGNYIMLWDDYAISATYFARYKALQYLIGNDKKSVLKVVETAWKTEEKRAMLLRLRNENAEGIVFKNIHSFYTPGRPNSGGDQLKFKFCATASCIVVKTNKTKRSISLAVYDDKGHYVQVGNCTVYPNQDIPSAGSIVEVKYLYYFPGGALFQPVLQGTADCTRDDIDAEDCKLSKLKEKRVEEEV
jgi:bifunctional non-homologous end joining protein LigD